MKCAWSVVNDQFLAQQATDTKAKGIKAVTSPGHCESLRVEPGQCALWLWTMQDGIYGAGPYSAQCGNPPTERLYTISCSLGRKRASPRVMLLPDDWGVLRVFVRLKFF